MKKEKQNKIDQNVVEVFDTSKKIRDFLLSEEVSDEEKTSKLKVLRTALDANKNIISTCCVWIAEEKLTR